MGVKVEEISGGEGRDLKVRSELAMQVYAENGRDGYREVGHFACGAPFLAGSDERISISHTPGLLVVATLAPTPGVNLGEFSARAALGVDTERKDREQVMKLREKFLNSDELKAVGGDIESNILAWTVKEAVFKAALNRGVDFKTQILIDTLPPLHDIETWLQAYFKGKGGDFMPELGQARFIDGEGNSIEFKLYSYLTDGNYIVTLAFTPETEVF